MGPGGSHVALETISDIPERMVPSAGSASPGRDRFGRQDSGSCEGFFEFVEAA